MRFAALALCVFVTAVTYGETETVEELIQMADEAGAPFTTAALEKMDKTDLWGVKRGRRSADIVIINKSGTSFISRNLNAVSCSMGSHVSPGLEHENDLDAHTSTVIGVQAGPDNEQAYVNCHVFYSDPQLSSHFAIDVLPKDVRGDIQVRILRPEGVSLSVTVRRGESTQAIIIVEDKSDGPVLMLSQQGASLVPQREPKGSRNLFVKASKHGNRVRTI